MSIGMIGIKSGMTRIFDENGASLPVTAIEMLPSRVAQLKTVENDGYTALQVAYGLKKQHKVTKPMLGHYEKAGVDPALTLKEFRLSVEELEKYALGHTFSLSELFSVGQKVDVSGTSKGKGFAGAVKRHNFATQDATHGNSLSHRAPGSIGQNQTPGRVFKGKKMAGHLGNVKKTVQHLEIVRIDEQHNVLFVKGAVPGATNSQLLVQSSVKSKGQQA